jgi:hypothetical protein
MTNGFNNKTLILIGPDYREADTTIARIGYKKTYLYSTWDMSFL